MGILKLKKKKDFTTIFKKYVDIDKLLVSSKISFGEKNYKHFIGYLYKDHKVKPVHIILSKTRTFVKSYGRQTNWIYFLIEDGDLLEKYNTIWDKVSADTKKEFNRKPVYNKHFLKTKIKSHDNEVTDFYDEKSLRWALVILVYE